MIRPEPKREPLPEPKRYEPPHGGKSNKLLTGLARQRNIENVVSRTKLSVDRGTRTSPRFPL